jgi:predicted RNA-binding protein
VEKIKLGFVIKNVKAGPNLVMGDVMIQQRENWIAIRNVMKENQEFRIVMDHASVLNYPVTENAKYVKK